MNVAPFALNTEKELKAQSWRRLDSLTKYKLANENDLAKLREWFNAQDEEWQAARKKLFNERLKSKGNKFVNLRY